jgi:hypothetical protein
MPLVNSAFLAGVWGSSARDVFAVGVGHTIVRYDGKRWTAMPAGTTPVEGKPNLLTRVWGSGPNDVYAAGFDGLLLHFDGKSWSTVPTGTTENLGTIWGFSPADVFVVGGGGTILHLGK